MDDFRREPAPPKIVALLVEEYLSFMVSRPGFMLQVSVTILLNAPPKIVALLVEEYLSFMISRPGFMLQVSRTNTKCLHFPNVLVIIRRFVSHGK